MTEGKRKEKVDHKPSDFFGDSCWVIPAVFKPESSKPATNIWANLETKGRL
jgi:hypothetical protein